VGLGHTTIPLPRRIGTNTAFFIAELRGLKPDRRPLSKPGIRSAARPPAPPQSQQNERIFHQTVDCQFTNYLTRRVHPRQMSTRPKFAAFQFKRLAPIYFADKYRRPAQNSK
jgi:hypothetical protein